MSGMTITELMTFKDKTVPAGWYQARILAGENVLSGRTGITGYKINVELTDYRGEVNTELYLDPIGYKMNTSVWHPDAEKQGSESKAENCARAMGKFINAFGIDIKAADAVDEDGFLRAADFVGLEALVKVKLKAEDFDEWKALKEDGREKEYEGEFFAEIDFGGFKKLK